MSPGRAFLLSPIHPTTWYANGAIILGLFVGLVAFARSSRHRVDRVDGTPSAGIGVRLHRARDRGFAARRPDRALARRSSASRAARPPTRTDRSAAASSTCCAPSSPTRAAGATCCTSRSTCRCRSSSSVVVVAWAWRWPCSRCRPGTTQSPASRSPGAVGPLPAATAGRLVAARRAASCCRSRRRCRSSSSRSIARVVAGPAVHVGEPRAAAPGRGAAREPLGRPRRRGERAPPDRARPPRRRPAAARHADRSTWASPSERIDTDPAAAKQLILEGQAQAREALAEIRQLVRGIAPSILLDRGLVPALESIAGRGPVPTRIRSDLAAGRAASARRRAGGVLRRRGGAGQRRQAQRRATLRGPSAGARAARLVVEVWDDGARWRDVGAGRRTGGPREPGRGRGRRVLGVAARPAARHSSARSSRSTAAAAEVPRAQSRTRGRSAPPARGDGRSASRAGRACRRCC